MNLASGISGFVLLSALSAAGWAQVVPHDASFDDLAFTKHYDEQCAITFPSGEIRTAQAFNTDRQTITDTVIITGRTREPLSVGEQLYVRNLDGGAYRALVTAADEDSASVAVHRRIIASLFFQSGDAIWLSNTPEVSDAANMRLIALDQDDETGLRAGYAELLDCAEELENS